MKEIFKICIIQPDITWEDPPANMKKYSKMLERAGQTDLIVLPEMFNTGFSMEPERLKEKMEGESVKWMKKIARERDSAITGSLIIEEENKIYNRCLWVLPDGQVSFYDKRHLFTMGGEKSHYSSGSNRLTIKYKGWSFYPLICYDLRFPVWSRNTQNYDVLIYMANWPAPRHRVWKALLPARAIENQAFCIGVNRVGRDGNGLDYLGDSVLTGPKGDSIFLGENEQVCTFNISYRDLHLFRKEFPVLEDRDEFRIINGE